MFLGKEFLGIVSIFYLTALEMAFAFGGTLVLDMIFLDNMKHDVKHSSTAVLVLQAGLYMGLLMVIVHYGKMILHLIPFPLDGLWGFSYTKMNEVRVMETFLVFAVIYWHGLNTFIEELRSRVLPHE
jgi:hypothetical protein